ncbi:MAG: DNA repair protein RecO [Eubacteriales bacterium]
MLITTDGLVARVFDGSGTDRYIHLLTPTRGRLTVTIKNGQSGRASIASYTQLFTYGNYELYEKNKRYWLRNGSVAHTFYNLTTDLEKMALASYLCDLTCEMTNDEEGEETDPAEESGALLRMLLNALYVIHTGEKPAPIVKGVFELRAAAMAGYAPSVVGCALCHEGHPVESYLDVMNGRLICADCQTKRNRAGGMMIQMQDNELGERSILLPLSSSVLAAVRYALGAPEKKIFSFTLKDKGEEAAFAKVAETFLLNHLERGFDTLDFYHSVKK